MPTHSTATACGKRLCGTPPSGWRKPATPERPTDTSATFSRALLSQAQQSFRLDQQKYNQHDQRNAHAQTCSDRQIANRELFYQCQDQSAEQSAGNAIRTANPQGGEALDGQRQAHHVVHRGGRRRKQTCHSRDHGTTGEWDRGPPAEVNAHQCCNAPVDGNSREALSSEAALKK